MISEASRGWMISELAAWCCRRSKEILKWTKQPHQQQKMSNGNQGNVAEVAAGRRTPRGIAVTGALLATTFGDPQTTV